MAPTIWPTYAAPADLTVFFRAVSGSAPIIILFAKFKAADPTIAAVNPVAAPPVINDPNAAGPPIPSVANVNTIAMLWASPVSTTRVKTCFSHGSK